MSWQCSLINVTPTPRYQAWYPPNTPTIHPTHPHITHITHITRRLSDYQLQVSNKITTDGRMVSNMVLCIHFNVLAKFLGQRHPYTLLVSTQHTHTSHTGSLTTNSKCLTRSPLTDGVKHGLMYPFIINVYQFQWARYFLDQRQRHPYTPW